MLIKRKPSERGWHKWFAWFPVKVSDADLAWMQFVERRGKLYVGYEPIWIWEYRLPQGEA